MPEKGNQLSQMIKDENDAKRVQGAVGIPDKTIHSGFDAIVNNQASDQEPVFETTSFNNTQRSSVL